MSEHFGPPPLKTLTVSPIPGTFGQGFPGLLYLSTITYLNPEHRPAGVRSEPQQTFFSEILSAHETAHQWWGNAVASAGYQDDWIMEGLANYSALLYLEKRKGARALESVLEQYKSHLVAKTEDGRRMDSAGPVIWGARLENSRVPGAWRTIIYEKGSWIMHMLRRRIGDERFLAMLGELRRRYQYRALTTEQFRQLAAQFLPPRSPDPQLEAFFDQWVYGTGIPTLRLNHSVRGKEPSVRITGTVTQTDADEDFSTYVPIEVQFSKAKPLTHWVRTAAGPVTFSLTVRQAPAKILLDPTYSVLATHR
jgi:aminopeptidase N